jgi:hypothetical protein
MVLSLGLSRSQTTKVVKAAAKPKASTKAKAKAKATGGKVAVLAGATKPTKLTRPAF